LNENNLRKTSYATEHCIEHPDVQNIHLVEIEDHLKYAKEHLQENSATVDS